MYYFYFFISFSLTDWLWFLFSFNFIHVNFILFFLFISFPPTVRVNLHFHLILLILIVLFYSFYFFFTYCQWVNLPFHTVCLGFIWPIFILLISSLYLTFCQRVYLHCTNWMWKLDWIFVPHICVWCEQTFTVKGLEQILNP